MGLSAYSTSDSYLSGASLSWSAPFRTSSPVWGEIVHDRAGADGGRVHLLEDVERLAPLPPVADPGHQAVALKIAYRGYRHAGRGHRAWEAASEVDAGQNILLVRVHLAHGPGYPALRSHALRSAGVHDVHGAEVGAARILVTDPLHHRDLARVVHLLHRPHAGVPSQGVVKREDIAGLDRHGRPGVVVDRVVEGYHRVHEVVAP